MKIDLFDNKEFIDINHLQEITSPVIFQRGNVPHPNGLVSNEIFGITTKSRKDTFAYINLHGYFFTPHIYKVMKRLYRNVEKVISGELYCIINEKGNLVPDENGETGIDFLYQNWDKIKWNYSEQTGMRNERIDLITKTPKNELFIHYEIVVPVFYRDIKPNQKGGGEVDDVNKMYAKLIRLCTLVENKDMFDFQFNNTNYNIQNTLVEIYDFFKHKLEKKQGLFRKYLMGKNVDNCTRTVITASTFHANTVDELMVDMRHSAIPISQLCSLCYPFVFKWVKDFFTREIFDNKTSKVLYNPVTDQIDDALEIVDPESYFNEKYIKKMIDGYIKDPESRFNKIEVPVKGGTIKYLRFTGKRFDTSNKSEIATISERAMTYTDLLFLACDEAIQGKHCLITRYPLLDEYGIFTSDIRVLSTAETEVVMINGKVYNWYPHIDFSVPIEKIATKFIDSVQFSNSYLPGLDGDFDGDQTTVKVVWTQEANEEITKMMNKKSFFINASGQNIRKIENEAVQTFYTMSKEPKAGIDKPLSENDRQMFLSLPIEEFTFDHLVDWFGKIVDTNNPNQDTKINGPKFKCTDIMKISKNEYKLLKEDVTTTLGRFIFNKIMVEGIGIENILGYVNFVIDDGGFGKIEHQLTVALREDLMTVDQMYRYTDTRDWLGLQFHSVITTSFTPGVLTTPKEVKQLKSELIKKYKTELENGDERISEKIEDALVKKEKEVLKDDLGMDLYVSGARGSVGNNLKNNNLMRGAIKNPATGKYDIVTDSLSDGLKIKDIPAHANSIVGGAYPKACGTAVSGYLAKELLSELQTEVLADPGTDCGTELYLEVTIPMKKTDKYLDRYIIENGKLKCLTYDVIDSYKGKTVKMRSPMFCIGVGKQKSICNKCAGDFYYKLGKKDIGLMGSRPAETTKRLNMKKFHSNLVKANQIDPNDMLL